MTSDKNEAHHIVTEIWVVILVGMVTFAFNFHLKISYDFNRKHATLCLVNIICGPGLCYVMICCDRFYLYQSSNLQLGLSVLIKQNVSTVFGDVKLNRDRQFSILQPPIMVITQKLPTVRFNDLMYSNLCSNFCL